MLNHSFWQISGLISWSIIVVYFLIRLIFGKSWLLKLGTKIILGSNLKSSLKQLVKEFRAKNINDETLAEVAVYVFWRFTRIGIIGIIVAGFPIWLLIQQNKLIESQNTLFEYQNERVEKQTQLIEQQTVLLKKQDEKFGNQNKLITNQNELFRDQNQKIEVQTMLFQDQNRLVRTQNIQMDSQLVMMSYQNTLVGTQNAQIDSQLKLVSIQNTLGSTQNDRLNLQNNLIEADRRSSLVFLMSNVLDRVDVEISSQREATKLERDSISKNTGFHLSRPLLNRIIALSRAFKPYRILEGDSLSEEFISPERGQLFISLMESGLNSETQQRIVEKGDFSRAVIREMNLAGANLELANLEGAKLQDIIFAEANLQNADLEGADLEMAILSGANLQNTNLRGANLSNTELLHTFFYETNLEGVNLQGANLAGTDLRGANLYRANLNGVDLNRVKITLDQLIKVHSLYRCRNLDPTLERKLKEIRPCLFAEDGCE